MQISTPYVQPGARGAAAGLWTTSKQKGSRRAGISLGLQKVLTEIKGKLLKEQVAEQNRTAEYSNLTGCWLSLGWPETIESG